MKNNLIYLAGFMGSGKSTIGPILANTIGWDSADLDKLIETKTGKKVREIFEQNGEIYFRNIESEMLTEFSAREKIVISLGGGTIADENNLALMKKSGTIIYLKASTNSFYKRLKYKRDRPNLNPYNSDESNKEKFVNRINDLMEQRKKYYEQADITIDTDNSSVGQTVDRIVKLLKKHKLEIK
jgi:shikimate kinase